METRHAYAAGRHVSLALGALRTWVDGRHVVNNPATLVAVLLFCSRPHRRTLELPPHKLPPSFGPTAVPSTYHHTNSPQASLSSSGLTFDNNVLSGPTAVQ
jgi:hypothetical protein